MTMEIHVKESTIVRPSQQTPKRCLKNTNLDLFVPQFYVPSVYFYRRQNDCSNFFEASALKEGLSKALVPFYPVAGRLVRDDNGRGDIECNAEGVLFVEAETGCVIDDFGDFTPSLKLLQLLPALGDSDDNSSEALFLVQATHFKCGGVSLGVWWHHTLADGISAFHFINTWASMTCGLSNTIAPLIDRKKLGVGILASPTFSHVEYDPPPSMNSPTQTEELQSTPAELPSSAIIKLSYDQLNTLKAKSKKDQGPTIKYSTFEILVAHIWRCMCKARGLANDQASKLNIIIDGRSRLNPPLPFEYFRNVLFMASSIMKSGDIQSKALVDTVDSIHAALRRMDDEYLESAVAYLEKVPNISVVGQDAFFIKCPNMFVTSWGRLPLRGTDFGWGRPAYMGPACLQADGSVFILPNPSDDGSISFAICLQTHHIQPFKKCFYNF